MGTIFIDGESVEFEGEGPANCRAAWEIIENFVSGQGRMIGAVAINGEDLALDAILERENFETLAFKTISPQERLLSMCEEWRLACEERVRDAELVATSVLRLSVNDGRNQVVAFLEKLRPLIEGLGILQGYGGDTDAQWCPSFNAVFGQAIASIDSVVDAVESRDCVRVSDSLALTLAGAWRSIVVELRGSVEPSLELGIAS